MIASMHIKTWIILIINSLIVLVVLFLSTTFYQEFSKVLDQRTLLHLNSIKNLKKIQLERLISNELELFVNDKNKNVTRVFLSQGQYLKTGVYDLSSVDSSGQKGIGMIKEVNGIGQLGIIDHKKIQEILLERTGMGATGESYLVGQDYRLRSRSRFFPNKSPDQIKAETAGVIDGLNGNSGSGIFSDYR